MQIELRESWLHLPSGPNKEFMRLLTLQMPLKPLAKCSNECLMKGLSAACILEVCLNTGMSNEEYGVLHVPSDWLIVNQSPPVHNATIVGLSAQLPDPRNQNQSHT